MLLHVLCKNNGLRCCNKLPEDYLDFATARSDVKIDPVCAHGNRLKKHAMGVAKEQMFTKSTATIV